MLEVVILLLGAFLGVLFTVWFQKPIERQMERLSPTWFRLRRRLTREQVRGAPLSVEFTVGPFGTDYVVVEGDGMSEITEANITCHYDPHSLELPEDLAAIRRRIEQEQAQAKASGQPYYWNGKLYGLKRFIRSRTAEEEQPILNLWFHPSDYYTYLATSASMDELVDDGRGNQITVREKYLGDLDWDTVVPHLAAGFGVAVSIITCDEILVIARRGRQGVGVWQDHFNTAVNEGLSRVLDMSETSHQPDPYRAVIRGATEELNIELDRSSIRFLTFGFETRQYQWGLQGYARVDVSASQIRDFRTMGAKDKWENRDLFFIRFEPAPVIQFILDNEPWTPFSLVSIIHTLINHFGRREVVRTLEREHRRRIGGVRNTPSD